MRSRCVFWRRLAGRRSEFVAADSPARWKFIDLVPNSELSAEIGFQTAGLGPNSVGIWVKNALAVTRTHLFCEARSFFSFIS